MKLVLSLIASIFIGVFFVFLFHYFTHPTTSPQVNQTSEVISNYSLENAPTQSFSGEIISLSGDNKWESRTATEPGVLQKPSKLQQGEEVMTGSNGTMAIEFPKGLSMTLSANTDVSIIQTIPQSIVIAQKSGSVHYTKNEVSPLFIRNSSLLTELKSGEINVSMNNNFTTISVLKGSIIAAYNNIDTKSMVTTVNAGERFIYNSIEKKGLVE